MIARACEDCGETLAPSVHGLYCKRCAQVRRVNGLIKARSVQPDAEPRSKCADCGKELSDRRAARCRACSARHNGALRMRRAALVATYEAPPPLGFAISAPGRVWYE